MYYDLKLITPDFDSNLMDLIIELEHLRKRVLGGTTHPGIFFQLKEIFHFLESLESARIEGNRTTITEFIEARIDNKEPTSERFIEIANMEMALDFIDKNFESYDINRMFISEVHKIVVQNLISEGSENPGEFRRRNVSITRSIHTPPDVSQVPGYMDELFSFINNEAPPKYHLLKTAIAHHRFAWIHPFDNGNGRTVRLLTYAMLVKQGFNIHVGHIINPSAVFCCERNKYYDALSFADTGEERDILSWCEYVLSGLKLEIEKIDRLLDHKILLTKILNPAISFCTERKTITPVEEKILKIAAKKQEFKAKDIKEVFPQKHPVEISRIIKNLINKGMIVPVEENARSYILSIGNNYLLRGIIEMLEKNEFLPIPIDQ
ncbi:MAG: Fic family protein [Candidatus Xenobiia bacterium LiM19]